MNDLQERPSNPFGDSPVATRPAAQSPALVAVEQQRVMAEVQAQMLMARANPRDPIAAMDRILNACTRPGLAEAAIYQYSRGGSDISGPSIRLAEAMAQSWGNIKTSVRELEQRDGVSTVQAIAWDLETGYSSDKVFQVPHLRYTKNGSKRLEDPRDVYENVANNAARRLRACILAVIPGDVTEAAVAQCEATMKAKADTSPEGVKKVVDAFAAYGVTKEQIEKRIQRRMDAIQAAQIVALKKVYASLRDGMSVPADWFEPEQKAQEQQGGNAGAAAAVRDKLKARQQAQQPQAGTRTIDPVDRPDTGAESREAAAPQREEPQEHPKGAPAVSFAKLAERLNKAKQRDVAELILDEGRALPQDQQDDLQRLYDERFPLG